VLVLAGGTALSVWAFQASRRDVGEKASARIGREVSRVRAALIADLGQHELALRAGAGFFAGSDDVTAAEFAAFVEKLGLEERDPGVRSLAFVVPVARRDLPAWLDRQRSRGNDVGRVMTVGDGPVLHVVQYSEPARRGARAIGWDAGADPAFRTAIERARETGQAALAGPLAVPHATRGPIFALEYPLYATAKVPASSEARLAGFRGTLALFLNVQSFMEETLAGGDPDIEVTLFDGPVADPARLLYAPAREPGTPAPLKRARRASDSLSIGGKSMTLVFTTLPGFEKTQGAIWPFVVLGGGLAMSVLLSGLLWAVSRAPGTSPVS
jgi:CHASE1-domain containing sensor protein